MDKPLDHHDCGESGSKEIVETLVVIPPNFNDNASDFLYVNFFFNADHGLQHFLFFSEFSLKAAESTEIKDLQEDLHHKSLRCVTVATHECIPGRVAVLSALYH